MSDLKKDLNEIAPPKPKNIVQQKAKKSVKQILARTRKKVAKAEQTLRSAKMSAENTKKKKVKISEELILKKIQERKEAKNNRNYDLADKIRNELLDEGILIEDQKEKTIWKFK